MQLTPGTEFRVVYDGIAEDPADEWPLTYIVRQYGQQMIDAVAAGNTFEIKSGAVTVTVS